MCLFVYYSLPFLVHTHTSHRINSSSHINTHSPHIFVITSSSCSLNKQTRPRHTLALFTHSCIRYFTAYCISLPYQLDKPTNSDKALSSDKTSASTSASSQHNDKGSIPHPDAFYEQNESEYELHLRDALQALTEALVLRRLNKRVFRYPSPALRSRDAMWRAQVCYSVLTYTLLRYNLLRYTLISYISYGTPPVCTSDLFYFHESYPFSPIFLHVSLPILLPMASVVIACRWNRRSSAFLQNMLTTTTTIFPSIHHHPHHHPPIPPDPL